MGVDQVIKLLAVENVTVVGILLVVVVGEGAAAVALWRRCNRLEAEANDYANRAGDLADQHDRTTAEVAERFQKMSETMAAKYEALLERFMNRWFKDGE